MFGLPMQVVVGAGILVLVLLMVMTVVARMYRKAGPNEALIVYGMGGTHVYSGRGAIIFPMVQTCRDLSLELMSFDVAPQQNLYTKQGVAVTVEAVAQIKVKSDKESILTAAEQFLSKRPEQRESLIRLVMEGHLRGIIGQLTVEQIVKEPEMVVERMRSPTISGSLTICSTVSWPIMPRRWPSMTRRIRDSRCSGRLLKNCSAAVRMDSLSDFTLICATASTVTA